MLIETHWHPDRMDPMRLDDIMNENEAAGIGASIIAGIRNSPEDNSRIVEICQKYKNTFFAVGDHPRRLTQGMRKENVRNSMQGAVPERLIKMLQQEQHSIAGQLDYLNKEMEKVMQVSSFYEEHRAHMVAIGETGLDYSSPSINDTDKAIQSAVFHLHIRRALDLRLPLILHIRPSPNDPRGAYEDAYRILKSYRTHFDGVIHCFCSDLIIAQQFIELGFLLGIGGMIFNPYVAREMENVIKTITLDSLVLETDSPYLMPAGFQSDFGVNTPAMTIPAVADRISQIMQMKPGDKTVEEKTTENAIRVFKLSLS